MRWRAPCAALFLSMLLLPSASQAETAGPEKPPAGKPLQEVWNEEYRELADKRLVQLTEGPWDDDV